MAGSLWPPRVQHFPHQDASVSARVCEHAVLVLLTRCTRYMRASLTWHKMAVRGRHHDLKRDVFVTLIHWEGFQRHMLFSGLAFQTAKFTHSHKSEAIMKKEKKGWTRSPQTCLCVSPRPVYVSPSDSLSAKVFFWSCSCVFLCPAPEIWFGLRFLPAIFILIQFPSEWWREPLAIRAPWVRAGGERRERRVCAVMSVFPKYPLTSFFLTLDSVTWAL